MKRRMLLKEARQLISGGMQMHRSFKIKASYRTVPLRGSLLSEVLASAGESNLMGWERPAN